MDTCSLSDEKLVRLHAVCSQEPRIAAVYAFGVNPQSECYLAALYSETLPWSDRLDLELSLTKALDREEIDLSNLRRMPLVSRYNVLCQGEPLYVGQPDILAVFVEETLARYSAYYPLLEALYWKAEVGPLSDDDVL